MRFSLALLLLGATCCVGCGEEEETTATPPASENSDLPESATSGETIMTAVNAHCPIMGGEVTDDGGRTDWNGKTIGFCCPGCIDEWKDLSEEDKEAKLTKAESSEGHDHGDHGDDDAHGDDEATGA